MKRIIVSICMAAALFTISPLMAAEKPVNDKGVFTLQIGTGLGANTLLWGVSSSVYGRGFYAVPPIIVSGSWGIMDLVSVGFIVGYEGWGYTNSTYTYGLNYIMIGARGDFHFNRWIKVKRLDVYAGIVVGANIMVYSGNVPYLSSLPVGGGLLWNVQGGVKWYFHENVGLWAEVGYGYSIISGGIVFKF